MFRARRYRVLLVFAAAFVLTFLHFYRSRDWVDIDVDSSSGITSSSGPAPLVDSPLPKQLPDSKSGAQAVDGSGRFAPAVPDYNSHGSGFKQDQGKPISEPKEGGKTYSTISWSSEPDKDKAPGKTSSTTGNIDSSGSTVSQNAPDILEEEIDHNGLGRAESKQHGLEAASQWKKVEERFPVPADKLIRLPKDRSKSIPKLQAKFKDESTADKQERLQRLSTVKAEFKHAWEGYKKAAMSHDELQPLSGNFADPFNGWGATLVDSLDTLWIMDMREDFSEAVDAIRKIDFTTSVRDTIPVFETTIRYLGGLLGAYDVSGQRYPVLLEKAQELAEILIGAFDTPNRMPVLYYRWAPEYVKRPHRASKNAGLAEIGSLSLEFTRLAQLTKQDKYYDAIARITNELEKLQDSTDIPGLWPVAVNAQGCAKYSPPNVGSASTRDSPRETTPTAQSLSTTSAVRKSLATPTDLESYLRLASRDAPVDSMNAQPASNGHSGSESNSQDQTERCDGGLLPPVASRDNKFTLGAQADSAYEYLPKEHLLLGGVTDQYSRMYRKAVGAARSNLLFRPMIKGGRDIRFMAVLSRPPSTFIYEGSHLSCYVGGMVAIGAKAFGIEADMDLAYKLTDGCVWAYEATNTGIMPERFRMLPCSKASSCEWDEARYEGEMKRFDHPGDSGGLASSRTNGENAYDQRVKLSTDSNKPQISGESSKTVPLPMPGSLNSHAYDPVSKRDVNRTGPGGAVAAPAAPSPSPANAVQVESFVNRDAPPRLPRPPALQSEHNSRPPVGMTSVDSADYLLRPEAIESVFIMFRLTGDDYWRRKGWKMFEAISKYTRSELANAAINDVTATKPVQRDVMESFWLAETLKYFYLLYSDPSVVDLDKYVLNTEAHPFLRPT